MIRSLLLLGAAVFLLSACADVELPSDGSGTDRMKPSPCACMQLPFDSGGYGWVG